MNNARTASWLFVFVLSLSHPVLAQYTETEIKAVYLERFTRFIEWPKPAASADASQPFVLGIVGENPFGSTLNGIYKNIKIKNRNVLIAFYSNKAQIRKCDLLYISPSEKDNVESILAGIAEKPILTVGDSKGFAEKGVHINLYRKNNKLYYEINESALLKSGFTVWAQLMSSAKIVNPQERK